MIQHAKSDTLVDEYERGYSRLAAVEDCDPDFLICRKFGWLHSRLLLHLQDDLQRLERELERLDKREAQKGDDLKLRAYRIDCAGTDSKRQKLLSSINEKLREYGMPSREALRTTMLTFHQMI